MLSENKNSYTALSVIILFFVLDFFTQAFGVGFHGSAALIPRMLFLLAFIFAVFNVKLDKISIVLLCASFLLVFTNIFKDFILLSQNEYQINSLGFVKSESILGVIVDSLYDNSKNIFTIFMFIYLFSVFKNKKSAFFKVYEWIIYAVSFCGIAGFLFNIQAFKTYSATVYGWRWGYGLFGANESSSFFIIALFYSMSAYVKERKKFLLIVAAVASMLVGSKALWILTPCALFVFFWKFYPKYGKIICIAFIVGFLLFLKIYLLPFLFLLSINEDRSFHNLIQPILAILNGDNFMAPLSSGRYAEGGGGKSAVFFAQLKDWSIFNYLFGGNSAGTEMEFFDMFSGAGLVGCFLLLGSYVLMFRYIQSDFRLFFTSFYLLLAAFGGHVFWIAANAPYLCLFILYASQKYIPKRRGALCRF